MNHRIGELGQSIEEFDCFTLSLYEFVPKGTLPATTRKFILEMVLPNIKYVIYEFNLKWIKMCKCSSHF